MLSILRAITIENNVIFMFFLIINLLNITYVQVYVFVFERATSIAFYKSIFSQTCSAGGGAVRSAAVPAVSSLKIAQIQTAR